MAVLSQRSFILLVCEMSFLYGVQAGVCSVRRWTLPFCHTSLSGLSVPVSGPPGLALEAGFAL